MKLEDIDIGVGLKEVVLGEKGQIRGTFKSKPINITEKIERIMISYLNELDSKSYEWRI